MELLDAALVPDRSCSASGPTSRSSTTAIASTRTSGAIDDVIRANVGKRPVYLVRYAVRDRGARDARGSSRRSPTRSACSRSTAWSGRGPPADGGGRVSHRSGLGSLGWRHEPEQRGARPRPLLLLPGPQRGGQPRGARGGGAGRAARRSPSGSRSSPSTTARRTRPPAIADRLAAAHPDVVRAVHHPTNLGYGAALRSGFRAARYDLVCFTDGDRQFRVADLGRLTARLAGPDAPGRRRRLPHQAGRPADPDDLRPPLQAGQPRLVRPPGPRRRLRLQALPAGAPSRGSASSRAAPSSRPSS